jgi:hypothetical protein
LLLATILLILNDFMRYLPMPDRICDNKKTGYDMNDNPCCFEKQGYPSFS